MGADFVAMEKAPDMRRMDTPETIQPMSSRREKVKES